MEHVHGNSREMWFPYSYVEFPDGIWVFVKFQVTTWLKRTAFIVKCHADSQTAIGSRTRTCACPGKSWLVKLPSKNQTRLAGKSSCSYKAPSVLQGCPVFPIAVFDCGRVQVIHMFFNDVTRCFRLFPLMAWWSPILGPYVQWLSHQPEHWFFSFAKTENTTVRLIHEGWV